MMKERKGKEKKEKDSRGGEKVRAFPFAFSFSKPICR